VVREVGESDSGLTCARVWVGAVGEVGEVEALDARSCRLGIAEARATSAAEKETGARERVEMADVEQANGVDVASGGGGAGAMNWPAQAVSAGRGEILLTLNQSFKAPKGFAYMPSGDFAPFEANWQEAKKRVRKPSAKAEDNGMFIDDADEGIFAADDSAKLPELAEVPEKPDEELTEEELELRRVQRKEQKRRQKEELLKRLQQIEAAKTQVATIEEKKQEEFARLPPPRPASARPIKATMPFDPYSPYGSSYSGGGGGSKSKKAIPAGNGLGYKKLKDGRPVTTARLQREYEIEQDREARRKDMVSRCRAVLNSTKKHRFHKIFLFPVDPVRQGIPDYPEIVKNPMDLGTVKRKLDERKYLGPDDFCADMRLIFSNCTLYNGLQSDAGIMGETVRKQFEEAWSESGLEDWTSTEHAVRAQEEIDIRNTPATPISVEALAMQEAREQLEKMKRELEELKRAKEEVMYKDDDFEDDDMEPVPRPKSRSRSAGGSKRARDPDEDPDFDFDDARMDEDVYREFKEESRARKEIKRAARAEVAVPQREMSFDEKHELTMLLQELPEEKQGRVIQIVSEQRKGLGAADDDEIEINIEELDSETLWKLDKYVRGVLRPKKRKLNAAEQLLEAKMREAQAARDLAAVEDTLKHVQETGGSYKEVVDNQKSGGKAKRVARDSDTDESDTDDSDSDTSSMDSAEGAGSNPEKRSVALAGNGAVDQSTNQHAKEATGIKQNVSKAAVNVENAAGWENLAASDTPTPAALATADAIPDELWSEFEAAAQQKQQLDKSRQEDAALAKAEEERQKAAQRAAEEAKKAAEAAAKAAEQKAREEAREKARADLENQEQTVDLEEQRQAMKQFSGDGMGGMIGTIDPSTLK